MVLNVAELCGGPGGNRQLVMDTVEWMTDGCGGQWRADDGNSGTNEGLDVESNGELVLGSVEGLQEVCWTLET